MKTFQSIDKVFESDHISHEFDFLQKMIYQIIDNQDMGYGIDDKITKSTKESVKKQADKALPELKDFLSQKMLAHAPKKRTYISEWQVALNDVMSTNLRSVIDLLTNGTSIQITDESINWIRSNSKSSHRLVMVKDIRKSLDEGKLDTAKTLINALEIMRANEDSVYQNEVKLYQLELAFKGIDIDEFIIRMSELQFNDDYALVESELYDRINYLFFHPTKVEFIAPINKNPMTIDEQNEFANSFQTLYSQKITKYIIEETKNNTLNLIKFQQHLKNIHHEVAGFMKISFPGLQDVKILKPGEEFSL